ncbi:hypothetical protein VNO78_28764 [Psophocarpus tetragonolobus]|uniref:Uncharacterized protein n=1 Tax=Psophocarpus tetragonolobus TaxID=3891 RepID=A0AAN9RTQ9_PSOTE
MKSKPFIFRKRFPAPLISSFCPQLCFPFSTNTRHSFDDVVPVCSTLYDLLPHAQVPASCDYPVEPTPPKHRYLHRFPHARTTELALEHLKPNDFIYVSGSLGSYTKPDGSGNLRLYYKVDVKDFEFVDQSSGSHSHKKLESIEVHLSLVVILLSILVAFVMEILVKGFCEGILTVTECEPTSPPRQSRGDYKAMSTKQRLNLSVLEELLKMKHTLCVAMKDVVAQLDNKAVSRLRSILVECYGMIAF